MIHRPSIIYGTAWKENKTKELTLLALKKGFRAVDTANQKKHYREDWVGEALQELQSVGLKREELFLQSKFTYKQGQDHRLPYDPRAPIHAQVLSSFQSSLQHLHTDYLDSYLLHGPYQGHAWSPEDQEAWSMFEQLFDEKKAHSIGVSNVRLVHLQQMGRTAKTPPLIVQNRCYASTGWDFEVRAFCVQNNIVYQGFSLLTANPQVVAHPLVTELATRFEKTNAQIVLKFAQQIGIVPLTGTTQGLHMEQDLDLDSFALAERDLEAISQI